MEIIESQKHWENSQYKYIVQIAKKNQDSCRNNKIGGNKKNYDAQFAGVVLC